MRYNVTDSFTKIAETTGTIQNISCTNAVEVSDHNQIDTGILLEPLQKISFTGQELYVRCAARGGAVVSVVPFEVDKKGGGASIIDGVLVIGSTSSTVDGSLWIEMED